MKNRLTKIVLLLLIQTPIHVAASGENDISPESNPVISQQSEYLSQDQITKEDYIAMSEFGLAYDQCMSDTSRAEVANYNDPRHVVDVAMKQCAVRLEELNNWLTKKRFPPDFRRGYVKKISGKTVREVMPQVMYIMSNKQQ